MTATDGNRGGVGVGRIVRPRPDWGDGWHDLMCDVCDREWVGHENEVCDACMNRWDLEPEDIAGLFADDTPPDEQERSCADVIRSGLLTTEQVKNLPRPEPLIDGWLNLDSIAELYGPSGVGKTHVAIDMAMHVAARRWWQGNDVINGRVLYVIAEGASGVGQRVAAWESHHGVTGDVTWYPTAVSVFDSRWAAGIAEVVAEGGYSLVVIDTLARSILGADENSSRDMGIVVAHLDTIRRAAGSCVLIVHHSGKSLDAGGRGSSALTAGIDTELELTGDATRMRLRSTKQKNGSDPDPIWFRLMPVDDSVIIAAARAESADDDVSPGAMDTLAVLDQMQMPGGLAPTTWLSGVSCARATFFRHIKVLSNHGLIENVGTEKRPLYTVVSPDGPGLVS